jgi:pimeloyl-ACP methyl ester carboxylesterase
MSIIKIGELAIAYEIVGNGKRTAAITPGGRFSKDTPGVRALAEKLAEGGFRVLIWDRPNCGESDVSFDGESESLLSADTLSALLRALRLAPALLIGGSAGSRVSLLSALRDPGTAERLFLFWISGGAVGLTMLSFHYCHDSLAAAAMGGMPAVAALPSWSEPLIRNAGNRAKLLSLDENAFIETMKLWAKSFLPSADSPVPGTSAAQLRALRIPTMVLRSGQSDFHHPRETSEALHALIPGSQIAEPPWGDREWLDRLKAQSAGEGLFARWPLLAPQILAFANGSN